MESPTPSIKTNRSSSRGCAQMLPCLGPKNRQTNDAALIDKPHRIPLTDSAKRAQRKLRLACVFSLMFMFAEVVGGSLAGSLAIMADAAHLLSDVAAFCISLFAIWMSTKPATNRLTFGFQRTEAVGAATSVLVIWVLTGVLVYAAVGRFVECLEPHPEERVDGKLMFIVACIGLLVNLILMKILGHGHSHGGGAHGHSHGGGAHGHAHEGNHRQTHGDSGDHDHEPHDEHTGDVVIITPNFEQGHYCHDLSPQAHNGDGHDHHSFDGSLENGHGSETQKPKTTPSNLNLRSAYLHALGDFIQSIGICIAGGLIWLKPEWQIADPIATFFFSVLVLFTTVGIIRESLHILMEGSPEGIDTDEIEKGLRACLCVEEVHDLHVWSLSAGVPSLSVHLVSNDVETSLHAAQRYLLSKGITHSTIQTEKASTIYPRDCTSDLKCGQVSHAPSA